MKAIVQTKYGTPDELKLKEIDKPKPKPFEVLIKIKATAVNDYDWSMVRGKPYLYRLMFGLIKPKSKVPGMELSGVVESIGTEVTNFIEGDAVYGDISDHGFGSFAEYICVNENALKRKPKSMTFEEATSISHASMLAYQALHDIGNIQPKQKILINGAGGGVGTFAFQLAKLQGALVTGVDTGKKLLMMQTMGFDKVIDYLKEDFTLHEEKYDIILDCKTNRSPRNYIKVVAKKGKYITVGGKPYSLLQLLWWKPWISLMNRKSFRILGLKPNKDLDQIHKLFEDKKLQCLIDGPYPLEEAAWAIQYFGEGKHTGKVVIKVGSN